MGTGHDEKDPALTEEIRAILHPRARTMMWLTLTLVLGLGAAAWVASHTVLAVLWR